MTHLDDVEIVDGLDGSLPAERSAHLELCAACRERLSSLRELLATARPADEHDVPEPSPLFWEHFSRRVREGVCEIDQPSGRAAWLRPSFLGWVTAVAVVAIGAAVLWNQSHSRRVLPTVSVSMTDQASTPAADVDWNLDDDAEWALVRVVATDLRWDDAQEAGLHARPGSAERVALEMSPEERQELARLIEFEMKRPGV